MKIFSRFLIITLICMLPLMSFAQTATPTDIATPTDLIPSPHIVVWPRLTYWHPYAYPAIHKSYEDLFINDFHEGKYVIDDVFYLDIKEYTEVINFEFLRVYYPTERIVLLLDSPVTVCVLEGYVTSYGSVTFDFSEIEPDVYRIYVLRGLPAERYY